MTITCIEPDHDSSDALRRLTALSRHLNDDGSLARHRILEASPTSGTGYNSAFDHVTRAPEDPILGVTVAYNLDPSPAKLNLGVGAYRTEGSL
ncbi:hypothetical protein V2J09_022547 [Rumex salicifolius]